MNGDRSATKTRGLGVLEMVAFQGMPGSVITISPRQSLDSIEQLVRARVERDGGVELAATTSDTRQLRQLRRLAHRLRADRHLACFSFPGTVDGGTYLIVLDAAVEVTGWSWRGDAKIG